MAIILLIEPDSIQSDNTAIMLRSAGHEVLSAQTADKAIDAADTNKFDLVIIELQLQTHGGIEFLHEFRSYYEWQTIPALLYTLVPVRALKPYSEQLKRLGVLGHYYKPDVSLTSLIGIVQKQLSVPA